MPLTDDMVIEVVSGGPTGPKGDPGAPGASAGGSFAYTHDQPAALATWVIDHGLNGFPNVTTVETSGNVVIGGVVYNSLNQITVSFAVAVSGKAYLS